MTMMMMMMMMGTKSMYSFNQKAIRPSADRE
jgi:hypothetical protein